jgi:hypothetical protein
MNALVSTNKKFSAPPPTQSCPPKPTHHERKTARSSTVSENAKKPRRFNALRPFSVAFEPLAQKHRSISCNPLLKFGNLMAAKTLNAQPCEVNPSKKCNHLSQHFALLRTA